MVDFQSRDTRRGVGRDEESDAARSDDAPEPAEESAAERGYAVVSVAPDANVEDDPAGDAAVEAIEAAGESVATREAIRPEYDGVQSVVGSVADRRDVLAVVTLGGTGVEPDDVTVDAVEPLLDKRLPGFGELFRMIGYDEVGTDVIGTRATAGIVEDIPIFCLPGAASAARRGVRDLVLAEAETLAALAAPEA